MTRIYEVVRWTVYLAVRAPFCVSFGMVLTAGIQHGGRPLLWVRDRLPSAHRESETAGNGPLAGQQPRTILGSKDAAWKRTFVF
jgi:hypothetical protein